MSGWGDSAGSGGALRIEVASKDVGRIIGRGGSRIRELQDNSGARIKILKEEAYGDQTPIDITGREDCQHLAKQMIEEVCSEDSQYGGGGGYGGGGYGGGGYGGGRGYGGGQGGYGGGGGGYGGGGYGGYRGGGGGGGPEESEFIQFPNSELKRLIGRGGSRIREIEDMSGCRVKILNDEAGDMETPVRLTGSHGAIQRARDMVQEVQDQASRYN